MGLINEQNLLDYTNKGYFVLPSVIPQYHLEMLRSECMRYIGMIEAEMDTQGADVIGINHRGRRYFISNRYKESAHIASFLFSDLMAEICHATLGETAYLFN